MNALIQVDSLSKYYAGRCAVSGLSFSLRKGEVLGFLGPNGAGKSSTLNMICGNLTPTSGRILINGVDIARNPRKAKTFLGYLPDSPPLYDDSTVDEFLDFCAKIHRIPVENRSRRLATTKDRCGLGEVGRRLIGNLSMGFRQRVGVAQAILHDPPIIVLDEPTVGLDPIQIRELRELIGEIGQDHGVIFSSHILSEVQSTCTRTLIIDRGRLILDIDVDDLEKNLEHGCLVIQTRMPAELSVLEEIEGVESVEAAMDNCYRIAFRRIHDPAERIAETVVGSGWGLLQLRTEQRTIEELFLQMTETKPGADPS